MRRIRTRNFGELDVDNNVMINFPMGLPGFEQEKEFFIYSEEGERVFSWLVSASEQGPAFLLINPNLITPEYFVDLPDSAVAELGLDKPEEAVMYVIVTVTKDVKAMTANFCAPIVINASKYIGKQVVLEGGAYKVRQPVLEALQQNKKSHQGKK